MRIASEYYSRYLLILAGLILAGPSLSASESERAESEEALDQVVVVAHKSARKVRDVAAHVTVLSRAEIDASLATSMADAFRYLPGIDYESAGPRFGDEGLSIRGIGGNRVAMLIDGVPMSDQFAVGSFSNATRDFINTGLIDTIEILHGPSSALYGSAAIGGVLAARTAEPGKIARGTGVGGDMTAVWHGADESSHGTALFATDNGSLGVLIGGSVRSGHALESAAVPNGTDVRDYERQSAIAKLVYDDANGNTWRALAIHQDAKVFSSPMSALGTGRFRTTSALTGNDDYAMDMVSGTFEFGSPESFLDSAYLRTFFQHTDIFQRTLDERGLATQPIAIDRAFSFEQSIHGAEFNLQKSFSVAQVRHLLAFGFDYRQRYSEEYRDGTSTSMVDGVATKEILGEVFPLRDFPLSKSTEWGVYLEDTVSYGDLTFIAALRADYFALHPENDPMYAEDYPFAAPVALSESDLSPKLGLVYRLNEAAEVYLQYAHGFRAPPYADANIGLEIPFFNYRAVPNPALRSESSDGFDIGLRWQSTYAALRVSAFRTRYTDFIESKVRLGIDPVSGRVLFQSQNIAETIIEGVEFSGSATFRPWNQDFSIDGSFYLARGENRDNGFAVNSVGPEQAVTGVTWKSATGDHQLRLQATLTGKWDDRDESGGTLYKPAGNGIVDFYYAHAFSDSVVMRAGLRNLGDRVHWNWSAVRGLSDVDPLIPYLAEPGRNFSFSVNYRWR